MSEGNMPTDAGQQEFAQAKVGSQQDGGGQAGLDVSVIGQGAGKVQNITGGASLTDGNILGKGAKLADPLDLVNNMVDKSVGKLNPFEGLQTAEMSPVKDMHASSGISSINTLTKGNAQGQG